MTPPLVGLIGRKRSGKDTFAERLIAEHGFARVAFADPLKAAALALDPIIVGAEECAGIPDERLSQVVAEEGWERAKEWPEVRRILQALGVAVRDHVDRDAWLNAAADTIRYLRAGPEATPVVVTDVRFPNEAAWIASAGGLLVRITRQGLDTSDAHVSETALDDYPVPYTVTNDSTIADLHLAARAIGSLATL